MPQFMRDTIQFLILYPVGGDPERTDLPVVIPSVGSAFQGIVYHDHHAVFITFRALPGKLQRVVEISVEVFQLLLQTGQIHLHGMPLQLWWVAEVIAEALLPEDDEVLGVCHTVITPLTCRIL